MYHYKVFFFFFGGGGEVEQFGEEVEPSIPLMPPHPLLDETPATGYEVIP